MLGSESNYWFQEVRFLRKQVGEAAIKHEIANLLGWDDRRVRAVLDQLASQKPVPGRNLAGDRSNPAAHRLPPAPRYNISQDELRALAGRELLTIGAHTMTHPILQNETDDELARQIRESISELAGLIGRPVDTFAYPNGATGLDYGPREQATLAACGSSWRLRPTRAFSNPRTIRSASRASARGRRQVHQDLEQASARSRLGQNAGGQGRQGRSN